MIKRLVILIGLLAVALPSFAEGQVPMGSVALNQKVAKVEMFITSAVENADGTATFPLHRGTSNGRTVWYVVLDSSDSLDAGALGVNHSRKLANARGTEAVQQVSVVDGVVDFPATVDFTPERQVVPGPRGFPPDMAQPGAIGEVGYSPLIELPDGTIRNAPHLANDSGQADKVVNLDAAGGTVTYRETNGFQGGRQVKYVSTDASDPVAAALEDVTFAPALNAAPFVGDDSTQSARASLAAFVNGQTGANNPQRQGLNSALLDGLDPLNVLRWNPVQGRYAPLWDVHLAEWSAQAAANGQDLRQMSFNNVLERVASGFITGPDAVPFGASGFIVNCPIVSSR